MNCVCFHLEFDAESRRPAESAADFSKGRSDAVEQCEERTGGYEEDVQTGWYFYKRVYSHGEPISAWEDVAGC